MLTPAAPREVTEWVLLVAPHRARGDLVNQCFDAAALLGFERWTIRSKTEGFEVPREVAEWLYPSTFGKEV